MNLGADPFVWHDGARTLVFGRGTVQQTLDRIDTDYLLLASRRAVPLIPGAVVRAASQCLEVPAGLVDGVAADLLPQIANSRARLIVAVGGGRVIDTAKAIASATQRQVAAIPTSLSAAEMTSIHRQASIAAAGAPQTRPILVINDPALSASQPLSELAASSANALAHAVEAPLTTLASPVPSSAAHAAIALIANAWRDPDAPDRDRLGLASLLAGYAVDASQYGLSHVCSQTLARVGGMHHAVANAIVLPHAAAALRRRAPQRVAELDVAAGEPVETFAARLVTCSSADAANARLTQSVLDECADRAAERGELDLTPPRATRAEIRDEIYARVV